MSQSQLECKITFRMPEESEQATIAINADHILTMLIRFREKLVEAHYHEENQGTEASYSGLRGALDFFNQCFGRYL